MSDSTRPTILAPPPPAQIVPAELPGVNALLTLAVCVVVVGALYVGRDMLIPITLAILLSFLLAPLASLLRGLRLGRTMAVLMAVLVALTVLLGLASIIALQISNLTPEIPRYQATLTSKFSTLRDEALVRLIAVENHLKPDVPAHPVNHSGGAHAPTGTAANPMAV